jgi:glycosyltransferase involved in cell wall biosynthesis
MWEEARDLLRRGHQVTVFTTDALDESHRVQRGRVSVEEGVEIHRFRNLSNRLAYTRYRFLPQGLVRALRAVDTDLVHLSETRHELAIAAWTASRRRQLPLVLSAHGTLPRRGGIKGRLRAAYDRVWVTPMLEAAAGLIAQTRHEADLYVRAGANSSRVHLVPLGTDEPPAEGEPIDFGVPGDAPVILFLGRIHALKGVHRLIRGFASMSHHPDCHLVIVGRDDGALEDARALAQELGVSDRVRFPGPLYGDARFDAYRRATVFAMTPTHYEETSLASLEAASVGTPLVVSAQAEVPFLETYGGGLMVGADADLGHAFDEVLATDTIALGRQAARMVRDRHTWPVVGEQLEGIFRAITR